MNYPRKINAESRKIRNQKRKEIPVEVINENVDRVANDEALTMPLAMLDGRLKKAIRRLLPTKQEMKNKVIVLKE